MTVFHATASLGDTGHAQVLDHDAFQRPAQHPTRELRSRFGYSAGVLAPHMPAGKAPIPTHDHLQHGGAQAQRLVRERTHHRISRRTFTPAASTPLIRIGNTPGDNRAISFKSLRGHHQSRLIKSAKHSQVKAGKAQRTSNARHVEDFRIRRVRTLISGRSHLRSRHPLHPNYEEPLSPQLGRFHLIRERNMSEPQQQGFPERCWDSFRDQALRSGFSRSFSYLKSTMARNSSTRFCPA